MVSGWYGTQKKTDIRLSTGITGHIDAKRYKSGECYRKWESFNGAYSKNITSGSIVKLAQDYGANIESEAIEDGPITTLDWDSFIGGKSNNVKIVDKD